MHLVYYRGLVEPVARSGNYLKSLYDHVKNLSTLVEQYSDGRPKGVFLFEQSVMLGTNPMPLTSKT